MTPFLTWLKPFYEAGLIQLCAAAMTLLAVMVALYPHFDRWRKRARLRVEIPKGYIGEVIEPQVIHTAVGQPGQSANPSPPVSRYCVAKIRLRNVGKTAAVGVRLTATDFYISDNGRCSLESMPESPLPPDGPHMEQLPAGLVTGFGLCGSSVVGHNVSHFQVGGAPGGIGGASSDGACKFNYRRPTLASGIHFVRLVACADGVTPATHFVALEIGHTAKVRLATKLERKAIRKADSARAAVEISEG